MKYLMIHKLVWIILVLIYTIAEMIFYYGIYYIIYVLWNFKFPKNWWERFHEYDNYDVVDGDINNLIIVDSNPWETIKRRYNIFFD